MTADVEHVFGAAAQQRVPAQLALGLVVERWLVEQAVFQAMGAAANAAVAALDRHATSTRAHRTLSGPSSDYLRALTGLATAPPDSAHGGGQMLLPLPVRLLEVTADIDVQLSASRIDVREAVAWEIASLCARQLMGEWASWKLLASC